MHAMIDQAAPEMTAEQVAQRDASIRAYAALRQYLLPHYFEAIEGEIYRIFMLVGWHRDCTAACLPGVEHVEYMEATKIKVGDTDAPEEGMAAFLAETFGVDYIGRERTERRPSVGPHSLGVSIARDDDGIIVGKAVADAVRPPRYMLLPGALRVSRSARRVPPSDLFLVGCCTGSHAASDASADRLLTWLLTVARV